jgi:hypothetical protein
MKSDLFLSEVVATRESEAGVLEVCAVAEGQFDRATSMLEVKLDAYLHNFTGAQLRPYWLPKSNQVTEHVSHDEIHEVGRDIFHRWVEKLKRAIPNPIPATGEGQPTLS